MSIRCAVVAAAVVFGLAACGGGGTKVAGCAGLVGKTVTQAVLDGGCTDKDGKKAVFTAIPCPTGGKWVFTELADGRTLYGKVGGKFGSGATEGLADDPTYDAAFCAG